MKRGLSDENGDDRDGQGDLFFPFPESISRSPIKKKATVALEAEESLAMLQSECRRRGLSVAGPAVLLRERLRAHSAGEVALMKKPRDPFFAAARGREGVEHIALPIGYHSGDETFLALPHDVIKRVLLPYVRCADLFSLALTCKYLHNDCMGEAEKRSKFIFSGDARATPMTLHLLCKLVDMTRRVTALTGRHIVRAITITDGVYVPSTWGAKERLARACAVIGLDDPEELDFKFTNQVIDGTRARLARYELSIDARDTLVTEYRAALWTLNSKRGTEKALATVIFSRAQKEAKKAEVALVARYKQDRATELNKALFSEIGVFAYNEETDDVSVTHIGTIVLKMFGISDLKKCRTFILKAVPTIATVVKNVSEHNSFYLEYEKHARKKRCINTALAAAAPLATKENATRLSFWLRAFFCLSKSAKGVLYSHMLELSVEYIEALVGWIARTSTLPDNVKELCPLGYQIMHAVFLRLSFVSMPAVHLEIDLAKPIPLIKERERVVPEGYVSEGFWQKNDAFPLGVALDAAVVHSRSWFDMPGMWIDMDKGIPPLIATVMK